MNAVNARLQVRRCRAAVAGTITMFVVMSLAGCDSGPVVSGAPSDMVDARAVTWSIEEVERRLVSAGLNPARSAQPVRQPFMSVPATLLTLDGSDLQIFIYADANAAAQDVDGLDSTRVAPPTMMISWRMPPTLVTDNNLAAILLTTDLELRRKVLAALRDQRGNSNGASSSEPIQP